MVVVSVDVEARCWRSSWAAVKTAREKQARRASSVAKASGRPGSCSGYKSPASATGRGVEWAREGRAKFAGAQSKGRC